MSTGNRGVRILAMAGLLLAAAAAPVWAGSGVKIALPIGPKPTVRGLALSLNCEWVDGRGYRPMTIDVSCTPPPATDRSIEVELSAAVWPTRNFILVKTEIEIPAGSTTVSKVIPVPQLATLQYLSLDVWEDGVHLDGLSIEDRPLMTGGMGGWGQQESPSLLFVSSTKLDISELSFLFDNTPYGMPGNTRSINSTLQVATFAERTPGELVENWLNYNSMDVIFLSLAELESLAAARPKVWEAIRQWTSAGGNLCVYGVRDDWQGLPAVDRLLKLPAVEPRPHLAHAGWINAPRRLAELDLKDGSARGWVADEAEAAAQEGNDKSDNSGEPAVKQDAAEAKPEEQGELAKINVVPNPPFVWKPYMLGRVVALANGSPFTGKDAQWKWVFNTIGPYRWKWRFRHGMAVDQDNTGFDNFLIGDIGLPPVRTYRVLITLFVLAIGPLNYWLLRRSGRLHLLLFTVPAAALLASGSLIGYVVVADGLEARLRARSFTQLDQRNREAVGWARLSYYTGLAPSGGLVFPADTAVLPLERTPSVDSFATRKRQLDWSGDQHLTRGWLASRTPTQFLTVRAYPSDRELTIMPDDAGQTIRVQNRLGARIHHLLVCDEAGKLHVGGDIGERGRAPLRLLDTDEAKKDEAAKFVTQLGMDAPVFPGNRGSELATSTGGFFPQIRAARMNWRNGGDVQDTSGSLLEIELLNARTKVASQSMRPRSYLAIVDRPSDVVVGMEGLIEKQSLHVISGTW